MAIATAHRVHQIFDFHPPERLVLFWSCSRHRSSLGAVSYSILSTSPFLCLLWLSLFCKKHLPPPILEAATMNTMQISSSGLCRVSLRRRSGRRASQHPKAQHSAGSSGKSSFCRQPTQTKRKSTLREYYANGRGKLYPVWFICR